MAESTDVKLPRSHPAVFPDRCVVCGRDEPGSHVRLMTSTIGWWSWLMLFSSSVFVVKAPACPRCAWRLHGMRAFGVVAMLGIILTSFKFLWPNLEGHVPSPLRKWAMLALALVCVSPQILIQIFHADPFDVTARSDSVDYEFTSQEYAVEFAALNRDAAWVKINGNAVDWS